MGTRCLKCGKGKAGHDAQGMCLSLTPFDVADDAPEGMLLGDYKKDTRMAETTDEEAEAALNMDLMAMAEEELDPELADWVEESDTWGKMLRHPLVYQIPLYSPGHANRTLYHKRAAILKAAEAEDWHTVVFLHERAYRLKALIDYVTGRDEEGTPIPLMPINFEALELVADVWVDSENIEQEVETWRALIGDAPADGNLWLGTLDERVQFNALPDPIPAWRGGIVGDWSWTTDEKIAQFFAHRLGADREPRHALIPKADCFGYLTRRGESELLVRLTDERYSLVYPEGGAGA